MVYDGDGKVTVAAKSIEIGELIWSHLAQAEDLACGRALTAATKRRTWADFMPLRNSNVLRILEKKKGYVQFTKQNYVLDQQLLSACTYFADKNTDAGNDNLRYFSLILIP